MYKYKLTEVPENILVKPSNIQKNTKWQSDYNVAAWFRFDRITQQPLNLHIQWQDANGEHTLCVDQTVVNASSLLLSGIARLRITGKLSALTVVVECDHHEYQVDELFVQPARHEAELKRNTI